ncbi:MAG: type I pullulanase [Prevotella sp.]|nr:type I pullulanase [Prevotella sp.]
MKRFLAVLATVMLMQTIQAQQFDFNECNVELYKTTFRLLAPPDAKEVKLRLYTQGVGGKPIKTIKMTCENGIWTAVVPMVKAWMVGKYYTFDVLGDKKNWKETPGVFAKAVAVNGRRAMVVDLEATNPFEWERDREKLPAIKSPADLVIYEMHIRDFSIARNIHLDPSELNGGRVCTDYPGKFVALGENWAINHLKSLGVNAVHLLPSFDFASIDESSDEPQYNWGYDPLNYNVPEGSYATNAYDPATRIRDFKTMVSKLHKAGIRVILDVVYNHTFNVENSNFQLTWPDHYYRKTADGKYSNGSGCGNETASERQHMRDFMIESVKYWINEYHIDGFRFDLMGVHDIETMNAIRAEVDKINPEIFIYGEGWSAGQCAYPADKLGTKANIPNMPRIAAFSDELRDALRGPFDNDNKGAFLAGIPGEEESLKYGIAGAIRHPQVDMAKVNYTKQAWATQPTQMISYVSCHDDLCLTDRLRSSIPGIAKDELIRLDLLAQTAVFTSQGVPFILSGEEMLRDKKGVHNSFESPDSVNELEWKNMVLYPNVFNYYSRLIQMRKNHPAFRLADAEKVRQALEFLPTQPCTVAFILKDNAGGDAWKNIIVVLNASKETRQVSIPNGKYTVVCRNGAIDENGMGTVNGASVQVEPQSALIIHN